MPSQHISTKTLPNDPSYPLTSNDGVDLGLTKREYFAAKIMASSLVGEQGISPADLPQIANFSVMAADALITALNINQ